METQTVALILVALVILQRLAELVIAKRNTARLVTEEGAYEVGANHYPFMIVLHTGWLIAMLALAWRTETIHWPLVGIYLLLQAGRIWVLATLGRYWTTRIIVVPKAPLVRRGPFRFVRHPNYCVVAGEIAVLPLALGSWQEAAAFTIANAAMLYVRIRAENDANRDRDQAA